MSGGYGAFPLSDEVERDLLVFCEFREETVFGFDEVQLPGWCSGEDIHACPDPSDVDSDLLADEGIAACFEGFDGGLDAAFAFVDEGGTVEAWS
ncbi:hypothetical protein C5E09_15045, partial [Rathayibacter iranicus]